MPAAVGEPGFGDDGAGLGAFHVVMSEFVFNKKRGVWTGLFLRMMQVICVKVEK